MAISMKEVADRLRDLETETGRLDPNDVVDAARDPASPIAKPRICYSGLSPRFGRAVGTSPLSRKKKTAMIS